MGKRDIKYDCLIEALEETLVGVEMIMNKIHNFNFSSDIIDEHILRRDYTKMTLELELLLATLCILLRKMSENLFITLPHELRKDVNSLIHSNRFDYTDEKLVAYSQKGREDIQLEQLLLFTKKIINSKDED